MTDNEVKTPKNKRKSITPQLSGKKQKLGNGAAFTPSKKPFNKNTPKQKSPKANQENNTSPKKVKAFEGTAKVGDKKKKQKVDSDKSQKVSVQSEGKKRNRSQFHSIIELMNSDDPAKKNEAAKKLADRIAAIEARPDQTKTSKRKLAWLKTKKNILEGKPPKENVKSADTKSVSQKRRERKKKGEKNAAVKQDKSAKPQKQSVVQKKKVDGDDEEESSEEDEDSSNVVDAGADSSEDEIEGEEDGSGDEGEGDSGEEEEDDDDNEEGDSDEEESEEEAPKLVAPKEKKPHKRDAESKPTDNKPLPEKKHQKTKKEKSELADKKPENKDVSLDDLKKKDLLAKGQKRFVLFVGNIPYDTTKQDLVGHFSKAGEIMHVRIPTVKKSNKPRGFAYLELTNEETYQKCMSMHHTFLKGRRINVLYTQGGKKKGDDKKKEIKAKNMKLGAMRRQGKLAGSVKESNKRSFRRAKKKSFNKSQEESNE